jgi:hypothetical protein
MNPDLRYPIDAFEYSETTQFGFDARYSMTHYELRFETHLSAESERAAESGSR